MILELAILYLVRYYYVKENHANIAIMIQPFTSQNFLRCTMRVQSCMIVIWFGNGSFNILFLIMSF